MNDINSINKYYQACNLCCRSCKIDRLSGKLGFCGAGIMPKLARAALHYWEEPCISGERGSGAVFFTHCSLKCVFCQNRELSTGQTGKEVSIERLSEIFIELQNKGAENINLVSPTHYLASIAQSAELAVKLGLSIPIISNTSSYETKEALELCSGFIDIYLADAKFFSPQLSKRYLGASDYFTVCQRAIRQMTANQPSAVFNERGMMTKGVIIRILLMPGLLDDAKMVLKSLFMEHGNKVYYSLMSQYTPVGELNDYPELLNKVTPEEYEEFVDYAVSLGIENGFIQQGDCAEESFIPSFDLRGI